jgi:hypothetical protein
MKSSGTRNWNILNYNIRWLNSHDKCNDVRAKIEMSTYAIFYIQETKRRHFDHSFVSKFATKWFNEFAFSPHGALGDIFIGWNNTIFKGEVLFSSDYAITTHYSNGEVPHATKDQGSFWWKDAFKLSDMFRGVAVCTVGDGTTELF